MKIYLKITCILIVLSKFVALSQNNKYGCQYGKNIESSVPIYYSPENHRSDTFDILKYTINLEIGSALSKFIAGNTQVKFAPKLNNRTFIRFDLLKLQIDSIKENTTTLTYTYNDTVLKVNFTSPKNMVDTSVFTVYYHGLPQGDPANWGGFSFNTSSGGQYAYNLGVGIGAKPHNYGRVWFPCFDNFVERSKYEFNITCDTLRRAYCNGELISDVISANKRTRKWVLNQEIPTYLASVAVANYTQVNWTVNTLNGIKPIILAAIPGDTTSVKNSFIHLKNCITGFENYYGPYRWNRFGYCVVPFGGGAMEHATNIAYPRFAIGNLTYESDIMAHELSHHWWGDLITCETQEDMWINEGMATFSAYLFTEWQYGKEKYITAIKNQHQELLQSLHHKEGGFRAVSGLPHNLTYGSHVYFKGGDIAHTLRGYMGDSAFFKGVKYVMQQNAFKSINSNEFRDLLQTGSGVNLTDFFNNWVFSGGWSHFAIDSIKYTQLSPSSYNAVIALKQKKYGAPALHSNVPLEVRFFKSDWTSITRSVTLSGATGTFTVNLPFNPIYHALNYDSKIGDATSSEVKVIKTVSNPNYNLAKAYLKVKNKGQDSSLVRIIHNYAKPDGFKTNPLNYKLSDQHFWKVEGILSPGFYSKITFYYDGNKSNAGYLDTLLTIVNGDSVRLFYRENAAKDWQICKNFNKYISGTRTGYIELDTLKLGEYAFGNTTDTSSVGLLKHTQVAVDVKVFPNPAKQKCFVEFTEAVKKDYVLTLSDIEGKVLQTHSITSKKTELDLSEYAKGTYFMQVTSDSRLIYANKILVE